MPVPPPGSVCWKAASSVQSAVTTVSQPSSVRVAGWLAGTTCLARIGKPAQAAGSGSDMVASTQSLSLQPTEIV